MAITIGAGAANYGYACSTGNTEIDKTNPANGNGTLTCFQVYAGSTINNFKIGTMYGSGTSFTSRDYEALGSVAAGSIQTFTGLSCDVRTGDCIANHAPSGHVRYSTAGGSGILYTSGDLFDGKAHTYTVGYASGRISIYGDNALAIDVGPGAIDRASSAETSNICRLALGNPANADGILTSFEIWASKDCTGAKMGTFYGSGSSWTSRDVETIGNVSSGSKQTFTGLNCDVKTSDVIGLYLSTGGLEEDKTDGLGEAYRTGDPFGAGTQTYNTQALRDYSLYATGVSAAAVTTNSPTSIAATSLTANGNITATGGSGSDVTRRGFCYMEGTSGDPEADGITLYSGEVVGSTANPSNAPKAFTAVNCTGLTKANGILKIDIKCDAPEKLSGTLGRQIELTSSGKNDVNEWSMYPPLSEITTSYKTFYLPLSNAVTTGGELDVSAINFIRIYAYSTDASNITLYWRNAAILKGIAGVVYDDGTFGTGAYTKSITGLTPATNYRIRAYAVNAVGTSYGATVQAKTLLLAPTVTTQEESDVTSTSLTANGNITDTGGFGSDVTRRGFCYMEGTSGDPTTENSTVYEDGTFGTGAYTKSITGLSPSTSYRVRAYAVNAAGTAYGTTVDATTDASMADLNIQATYQSMAMTANAASLNSVINVSATTDAMSVTGYQATINVAVSVAATCASMSISALASDVDIDVTVNATCDALSLTENNVSINAEKNVSCTVDSLTTQTYPANINSKTRVAASVDSLVIAEYTASINKAVNVSCSLDTMTLTSKAASVGILYNANASLVELIITTYGVSIDSGMAVAEVSSATSITSANLMVDKTSGYASILGMWMGGIGTRYSTDGWSTLLSVNDIASGSTVEEVVTTQKHILDIAALESETGTESITVVRNDTLSVADITSATNVESIVALVDKILVMEDLLAQASIDNIRLQSMNSLAIAMGANNLLDGGEAERCLRRM